MGLRILLVEDEFMVALVIEEALRELDCQVIGPVADLDEALVRARDEPLDGALLDINLNGALVYPVAEILQARGIPFAFTTGYAGADLQSKYRDVPRVQKPAPFAQLHEIVAAFGRGKAR